ncbi:MAG: hypothetical protein A2319_00015 [Candidatus Kerfeldbacteria bacterium RIFOXYB2_FULL_38_14]|uniref:Uncharacterized protein n=1 Tax=Candidatus Kerfeldbacteria bacterium RIFOXYB2_FULL_38_14 TaxID=1798547 RepID=A0A1G2BCZ9_9BACT|nr:MAG: hypothetical protein A2319_00015 [Candidatus Kerfeldbacteria bacterium RIFOXYB2_FULL_38_14]
MYIYKWIRADLEEIDEGPFETGEEARKKRDRHASFGATCSDVQEVDNDYKPYKGDKKRG